MARLCTASDHGAMTVRPRRGRLPSLVVVVTACVAATACLGIGSSPRALPAHEVLGVGTGTVLVVDGVASSSSSVKVTRSEARHAVENPFAAPDLAGPLRQFGLAKVTTNDLAWEGD